jgi:hypothetical protein
VEEDAVTWDIGLGLLVLCGLALWFLTGGLIWVRSKQHVAPRRERLYAAYVGGHPEVVVPAPTFCILHLGARGLAIRIRWAVVEIPFHHFTEAAADAWEGCPSAPAGMTDDCLRLTFTHPRGEVINMYFAIPTGNAEAVAARVMEVFGEWRATPPSPSDS